VGQPAEVYRRPACRFVADFIGRTNFVPARVVAVDGSRAELDSPGIGRLVADLGGDLASRAVPGPGPGPVPVPGDRARGRAGPQDLSVGAQVDCSLRPEAIRLLPSEEGGEPAGRINVFSAELVETVYLGEMAQHTLRLSNGSTLEAYELHPQFVAAGGRAIPVRCQVDAGDVTIMLDSR
jgi:ABC-type Fe3+/spermidine/putrescine transport system ATPase subunit